MFLVDLLIPLPSSYITSNTVPEKVLETLSSLEFILMYPFIVLNFKSKDLNLSIDLSFGLLHFPNLDVQPFNH